MQTTCFTLSSKSGKIHAVLESKKIRKSLIKRLKASGSLWNESELLSLSKYENLVCRWNKQTKRSKVSTSGFYQLIWRCTRAEFLLLRLFSIPLFSEARPGKSLQLRLDVQLRTVLKLHSGLWRQPWGWRGPRWKWVWHPWVKVMSLLSCQSLNSLFVVFGW